ncbi:MAG: CotH kinase family protein [Pirellulales bacterium]
MLPSHVSRRRGRLASGRRTLKFESLERRSLLAANVVVSEFLALNNRQLADEDGDFSDWIELYNAGDTSENLDGWFLTDDSSDPTKWRLPDVELPRGAHLLVFASGKDRDNPAAQLHTNFKLEQNGEYLGLVRPDGLTIASEFAPTFPPQRADVSYGPSFTVTTTELVVHDAPSAILIPTTANGGSSLGTTWTGHPANEPFNDASWTSGPLPVGYGAGTLVTGSESQPFTNAGSAGAAGFVGYRNADATLRTSFGFAASASAGGTSGEAGGSVPGRTAEVAYYADTTLGGSLTQQHALSASGRFSVESITALDGGFEIGWFDSAITQGTPSFLGIRLVDGTGTSLRWGARRDVGGFAELILPTDQLAVGQDYRFTITYDPIGGGANVGSLLVEFRRASDNVSLGVRSVSVPSGGAPIALGAFGIKTLDFNANIGGSANVFIDDLVYTTLVTTMPGTNVETAMRGVNSSAFVRSEFSLADPAGLNQLQMRVRYNDGFVAYLNGVEVARRNAPDPALWNSAATLKRTAQDAAALETIDLTAHLTSLRTGSNVLAIHGLNFSAADNDFLLEPELIAESIVLGEHRFHLTPTPLDSNGTGVSGFVADTQFSIHRGYYIDPIDVAITSTTPGATIVYTLDGSVPTLAHGTQVPAPDSSTPPTATVSVSTTTTLRAAAFKPGFQPTNVDTQTYVFANHVAQQSSASAIARGYPPVWQPGVTADYAMDPNVVSNPQFSSLVDDSLQSIPTLSIVMDPDGLFGPTNGIYNHSENRGDVFERASSVEWIDPAGGPEFHVKAGVRIHGGSSRSTASTLKHSLRVSFDGQHGDSDLEFPLFPGTSVERFDKLVLRGPYTDSWTPRTIDPEYHPSNAQYIRDQWMRDTHAAMGHLAVRGRHAHVYLNGLYWGLYNVTERTDAQFAAAHLPGSDEEYDAIKDSETLDGDRQAWDAMMAIANAPAGLAGSAEYQAIQQYLDPVDLADYMLVHIFSGGLDWPDHNWAAVRRRLPGERFRFLVWDQDIGLDDPSALTNHATVDAPDSPARLYNRLLANGDFRRLLGDRIQKHFFNDGVLTVADAQQRYLALASQIDVAVIAESARWGDVRESETGTTYTRNDWLAERDHVVNDLIPQRHMLALSQLRAAGLFPSLAAPSFSPHGGRVVAGTTVSGDAPAGTVYYTLDGSDPRAADGSVNPQAQAVGIETTTLVPRGVAARVLVPTAGNGGDLLGASWTGAAANEPFNDASWLAATTAVGFPASTGTETVAFASAAAATGAGWSQWRTHDVALGTDYGFRSSASAGGASGEAGGRIPSRTASISYYADMTIGAFSQRDPLTASGKFTVATVDAGYDGGFHIGFFDSSLTEGSPSIIGLRMLENTTAALRWQARAVINGQVFEASPLANLVVGQDYTFNVNYTTTNDVGHLVVTLVRQSDGATVGSSILDFGAAGAPVVLDAFGLMSLDLGVNAPQSVNTFIDDLVYSSGTAFPVVTDLEPTMRDVNASALLRTTFELAEVPAFDALLLAMQYDDAFVAYLNGVEVARSATAPVAPTWNSAATSPRADDEATDFVTFDISQHAGLLRPGTNVLAVHGMNVSAADGDFLLQPELKGVVDLGSDIVLSQTATLKARAVDGGQWSALTETRWCPRTLSGTVRAQ